MRNYLYKAIRCRRYGNSEENKKMKETIYDLKHFVEKVDMEKTIHYRWHVGSSYHNKFEMVFEASGKAKDGDYAIVCIKKESLDKEINERMDKFVNKCLEGVKEEQHKFKKRDENLLKFDIKEPEWGAWE